MKKLNELYDCNYDITIKDIKLNSKEVSNGDLFVCTRGSIVDRHDFIDEAIKNGASALIVERGEDYKIPFIKVNNTNKELGPLSKRFYDNPLKKIKLIGITGTDGKTTTASIIRNMLGNNNCGYIGTNGIYSRAKIAQESNTTLEINKTYKYLDKFLHDNLKYASIEISSEALLYNRVDTLKLDVAILTNITEDHLNVHKTIDNYIESKEKIFSLLKDDGVAILNRDDKYFNRVSNSIHSKILTYGKSKDADLKILDIKEYETGTMFRFGYNDKTYKVISPLVGDFNVYNLCSSLLCLIYFGYTMNDAIEKVTLIESIVGRCEWFKSNKGFNVVLDYAHTENALNNILTYLNKVKKGKIITVTGSAGGREKQKRIKMGNVVLQKSDFVIFTMDDPRYENVDDIIDDMIGDTKYTNFKRIDDRKLAIKYAFSLADENDIVLIAGKGRDNYMAINDKYIEYSDYDEIMKNLD